MHGSILCKVLADENVFGSVTAHGCVVHYHIAGSTFSLPSKEFQNPSLTLIILLSLDLMMNVQSSVHNIIRIVYYIFQKMV
jgi:hypothetical protein